jgi:DegV family protein with EDD domain
MAAIRVVTDSASDLPPDRLAEHAIGVVPLDVRFGGSVPEPSGNLSAEEFWKLCDRSPQLPQTSAPSPGAFAEAFRAAAAGGASVICVTLSSKLSATYQAAVAGAEAASDVDVRVVDSLSASLGEGIVVLEAAAQAERSDDLDAVERRVRDYAARVEVYATLDTLENLRRGGRIGAAHALLGSLLSIKPVIEVRDGVVEPESRQRTRRASLQYLAGKVRDAGAIEQLGVIHALAPDLDAFLELLAGSFPPERTVVGLMGPVIGTHTGRGTVGVCFVPADRAGGDGGGA